MWEDIAGDWAKSSEIDPTNKFAKEYHIRSRIGPPRLLKDGRGSVWHFLGNRLRRVCWGLSSTVT